jgi:hypothetical protein
MPYRAWVKPDNGDWLIVQSRDWPTAGDCLSDSNLTAKTFAPCEILVVDTETREVSQHFLRRWLSNKTVKVAIGRAGSKATYVENDGRVTFGIDWNDCPGVGEQEPSVTPEQLRKQADETLSEMRLPEPDVPDKETLAKNIRTVSNGWNNPEKDDLEKQTLQDAKETLDAIKLPEKNRHEIS